MNIAALIQERARLHPEKRAVVLAVEGAKSYRYPFYTFAQFEDRSQRMAARLARAGAAPGDRVLVFVTPCLDFSVIVFALFKLGAVPVLIDPGMGVKNLLRAVKEVRPQGLVGVARAHVLRFLAFPAFASLRWRFGVGPGPAKDLLKNLDRWPSDLSLYPAQDHDLAAILFTSGGTGKPKGVMTTHGILRAQTKMLQEMFELTEQDVDLPGFPLFALFTLAMGMTSVIPVMDPTRPAQCDPQKLVRTLIDQKITFAAGSPAIWRRVVDYCLSQKITLPQLRHVVMFGAPVRLELHEKWAQVLPNGDTSTPYGATECLPVCCAQGRVLWQDTREQSLAGQGICIGKATPGNEVFIVEESAEALSALLPLAANTVGEICVRGPTVTPGYFADLHATALAKIQTPLGLIHRMGDVGRIDAEGRVWFYGRKAHVVRAQGEVFYPIPCEAVFNQHAAVERSALVDLGGAPGVVLELRPGQTIRPEQLFADCRSLAKTRPHTAKIDRFFVRSSFPVDVRHNIKIDRKALGLWAREQKA